ncbi:DUF3710 domain-containing protein [Brachybacterium endophyticum]|uniref:DUF3710 domain-containing protein n=1 Tax=Brachybacterium endophyticum TaxID=2182385 RepID=A0A2U2RIX8_9MICO|nr:DUF3710 domain-containing protein [Brachybacterium endophyticum]PWH05832.1 DUF3710 domain-containing protein [Brachybacterium endophyticum]
MGLFSRKKDARRAEAGTRADAPDQETPEQPSGAAEETAAASHVDADPTAAPATAEAVPAGEDRTEGTVEPDEDRSHLEDGPFDADEAPEEDRIDLGGLQVPMVEGMELRMEMDQRTHAVTGANLVVEGSALQVQAFAAPKSRGLWEEVRGSLRGSVVDQGGTAETRTGPFGTELITRLPVKRADGRVGYRPARFIGVDGPRWLLRAILSGPALGDAEASRTFETLLSRIVVVRGSDAMAPQELIPLNLPGQRPGVVPAEDNPLDPLARGPEITEIG